MSNRLRKKAAKVSFFAFQDMITTVTGVLMIVMLLLSLDVTQRAAAPNEVARRQLAEQLEKARQQLTADADTLQERRMELDALTNRVFVVPDQSEKEAVLIVLSAADGYCCRAGETNLATFASGDGNEEFKRLLDQWDPTLERLVFYVRPSGILHFERCRDLARQRGFAIGYDAAEESRRYVLLNSPGEGTRPIR
jgi:hypothetical protein